MSYFSFGSIKCSADSNFDIIAWHVLKNGMMHKINLLFQHNIHQRDVVEMLDEQIGKSDVDLFFMLTSSPIHDTSEELISPPYFGEQNLESVKRNLIRIAELINDIMHNNAVLSVVLCFTLGYDIAFQTRDIRVDQLVDVMRNDIIKEYDIPSIKFNISR